MNRYQAKLVFESIDSIMEFQRGRRDPSETLNLGKKKELEEWLRQNIPLSRFKINSDWTVDVKELVMPNKYFKELPDFVQFNVCQGDVLVRDQYFITLTGFPKIVKGDFMVDGNKLEDIDGCPEEVGGDFYIKKNNKKFTVDEIKAVCNVGGRIVV